MPKKKDMKPRQVVVETTPNRLRDVHPSNKITSPHSPEDDNKPLRATFIHLQGLPKDDIQAAKVIGRNDQMAYLIPEHPLMIEILQKLMVNTSLEKLKKVNKILTSPPPDKRFDHPGITIKDAREIKGPEILVITIVQENDD